MLTLGTMLMSSFAMAVPAPGLETLQAYRRVQCSLEDNTPAVYGWNGSTYSRVPGEPDKLLFTVTGMNIRQCVTVNDPERGTGFRMVSREILLYQDPQTGEILDTWENPWSGKTVEVIQVENDPVNQRPMYEKGPDGSPLVLPFTISGNQWWMTSAVPLFYTNALGGDYQPYVGNMYHATEMFNFFGDTRDLAMQAGDTSAIRIGWVRISDWLPWMEMRGRSGILYFHTAGRKLNSFEDLPDIMKDFIDTNYPKYREAPPVDDTRPNVTSWTYFKKVLDARKKAEAGSK
jgi:hypothetical protein